jgi:hypothetical protein
MKSLLLARIATFPTLKSWVKEQSANWLNRLFKAHEMENNLDPLEEYYASLSVEKTYLTACLNCGTYSSLELCCEYCEEAYQS